MPEYESAAAVRRIYGVTAQTLRRWERDGLVSAYHLGAAGRRFYRIDDVRARFNAPQAQAPQRARVIYARVSSRHQQADLDRQVADLRAAYPDHDLIADVGSGLNFHRSGFTALLERVRSGMVEQVVVAHRDRLCRFALELVEWFFERADCRLVVHGDAHLADGGDELRDDLLAVVTHFVARHNGWLCRTYRVVLLPRFETQQMVRRGARRIRSRTARSMLTLSHYRFRTLLQHKAREHPWCEVVTCSEEYTSKTCGACGAIHARLGGSKRFACPTCGVRLDRDVNGARNILLKYLSQFVPDWR
jgi:predicted site-specific integrase-resolvase/predicted RNA-binding Zn-ribbon protein involved in translation (DUF1610 family)